MRHKYPFLERKKLPYPFETICNFFFFFSNSTNFHLKMSTYKRDSRNQNSLHRPLIYSMTSIPKSFQHKIYQPVRKIYGILVIILWIKVLNLHIRIFSILYACVNLSQHIPYTVKNSKQKLYSDHMIEPKNKRINHDFERTSWLK